VRAVRSILATGSCCALLASLAAGCNSHPAAAPPAASTKPATPTVKQKAAKPPRKHERRRRAKPKAVPRKQEPPKVKVRPAKKRKQARRHRVYTRAWRQDGLSLVAYARSRRLSVYASPRAKRPRLRLPNRDENGTQTSFLVQSQRPGWLHVHLPTRPNGSTGWVRRDAVKLYDDRYLVVIRLRRHELELWDGHELAARYPVAVGTSSTPTPRGLFYVVELLQPSNPDGSYGPYSFGLSAHSNVLRTFAGGDGRVGLHGTNQPDLIGSSISHGCIRVRNESIRRLARVLPLGTPVEIRA
jgi:lipoprotein-anchoring transpeptidase ErfK/SrfK